MVIDPVASALTSAVGNAAIGKIVQYIEESDDPESAWKKSGRELGIKIRTVYRQHNEATHEDTDTVQRQLEQYGKVARERAVRGEAKGFDDEYRDLLAELATDCANLARGPSYAEKSVTAEYEEKGIDELIENLIEKSES